MSTSSASAFATTFAFATAGAPFILTCGLPSCAQGQSADVVVAVHVRDCSGNTLTEWDLEAGNNQATLTKLLLTMYRRQRSRTEKQILTKMVIAQTNHERNKTEKHKCRPSTTVMR